MTKNVPEWISNLALDIYKVIQKYKAMPHFNEMVNTWTKSQEAEIIKLKAWKEKRKSYFEQTVTNDLTLQDENKQPEQDWQFEHHNQHLEKKTASGNQSHRHTIQGWVPPELSYSAEPVITHLLPLKNDQQLTIIEKGTILAAVYECGQKGTKKLSLSEFPDNWSKPDALSKAIQSIPFEVLCTNVPKIDQVDEGWLRVMLDKIENELSAKTGQGNKDTKSEPEEMLKPIPPKLLQNLLWLKIHGKKYWKIIVLAIIILASFYYVKAKLENNKSAGKHIETPKIETETVKEAQTSGDSSPAIITSGPNSPVTINYESETGKHIINSIKKKQPIPANYKRTNLYVRTKKRVDDFYESIRNEKLDPWQFINAGVKVQVTKHNGDVINYRVGSFTGAPRLVFWSNDFIPPFIEDAMIKVFDQTIDECRKNGLDPEMYVYEAKRILSDFIYKIYNRMVDMDQKLMKKALPENSGQRDVSKEIEEMRNRLDEHYNAALLLSSGK